MFRTLWVIPESSLLLLKRKNVVMISNTVTSVTYAGTGSQTIFAFPFDYLRKSYVTIQVDYVSLEYDVDYSVHDKEVTFVVAPAEGAIIDIVRATDSTPLVSWVDASVLKSSDMTINQMQELHILEEMKTYLYDGKFTFDENDTSAWNALNARIKNLVDPVDAQDAVTKGYIESVKTGFISTMTTTASTCIASLNTKSTEVLASLSSGLTSALASITTLKDSALSSVGTLRDAALSAIGTLRDDVVLAIETLRTSSLSDITTLKTTCLSAITTLKDSCLTTLTTFSDDAIATMTTLKEACSAFATSASTSAANAGTSASAAALSALSVDSDAISASIATKAPIASPTFTGVPKVPTASYGDNSQTIANTEFLATALSAIRAGNTVSVTTGTLASGATIPLPSGYTREQCKYMVSMNYYEENTDGGDNKFACSVSSTGVVTCYTSWYSSSDNKWSQTHRTANYICVAIK